MPRSSCSLSMVAFTSLPDAFPGQVGSQKKDVMGDECMKNMKNDIAFFENWVEKLPNPFFPTKNCNVTGVKPDFQTHPQLELTNQPCSRLRTPLSPRPPARRRDSNLMEASSGMISRRPFSSNLGHTRTSPEPCPC